LLTNGLRHSDIALVPVVTVSPSPRNTFRQLIGITHVADWSTLCISASVVAANAGSLTAGAVVVQVLFYQLSGTSTVPNFDNTVVVGGRSLCVGLSDQRAFYMPSSLDVRLPILAPFVDVQVYFPSNQIDEVGLDIGVWLSNDPSYQYVNPVPAGYNSTAITAADSILGENNSGYNDPTRGILVPANTVRTVELLNQTIGKGWFHFQVEAVTPPVVTAAEVATWISTASPTDTTGNVMDQVIHTFGNTVEAQASGVPLVGFRQGVTMFNFSGGAPRDFVWHWTAYPEFV
jgi:hypothetical protein